MKESMCYDFFFFFLSLYYVILYKLELINILHIQIYEKKNNKSAL